MTTHKVARVSQWRQWSGLQRAAVLLLLIAGSIEIVAIIALPFAGYDTYNHIYWIGEWHNLWAAGIFYPRWLPDSYAGFGAPTFYFYPPFTYFFSSAFYAAMPSATPESIGKILALIALLLSGLTMWLYLRWRMPNRGTNILGALLYMFAPYRFFDYSTRGALSEHVSLLFVPLVFWGADYIIERREPQDRSRGFALLIGSISLLIITNLPTAVVVIIGAAIYALAQGKQSRTQALTWGAAATIFAGLLSTFYLLPAYAFRGETQMGRLWTAVPMSWSSPLTAIFTGENITINIYTLLMFVGAAVLLAVSFRERKQYQSWIAVLFAVLVLQLPVLSYYLFYYVPPFTVAQLPYRFSVLVLIAAAILWQNELRDKTGRTTSLLITAWSLATIALVVVSFAKFHVHADDRLPIGDAPEYATHWEHPPAFQKHGQQAYLNFASALAAPFTNDSQSILLPDNGRVLLAKRTAYSDTIEYTSEIGGLALFRRSYWPLWRARVDGMPVTTAPDSLGRLTIAVPKGQHYLIVWLETSPVANIGTWISLGTAILLAFWWIVYWRQYHSREIHPRNPSNPRNRGSGS